MTNDLMTNVCSHTHHFFVRLLAFVCKCIQVDIKLGHQVDEDIDPSFGLKEFIQHHYFLILQYAVAALKGSSFITDDVAGFFNHFFDLV